MRSFAHLRALLGGYFWKPCPVCGRHFGGHESKRGGHLYVSDNLMQITCPRCPGGWVTLDGRILRGDVYLEGGQIRFGLQQANGGVVRFPEGVTLRADGHRP